MTDTDYPDWLQDKPAPPEPTPVLPATDYRFEATKRGLIIHGQPTFEDWQTIWRSFESLDSVMPWILGDLLCYGELSYGEMYTQVLGSETGEYNEQCHFKPGTLRDYKYVAGRFPLSSRLYALPWSYYQTVAGLEHATAMALLQHCEDNGIKRPELRQNARAFTNGKSNLLPATKDDINHELTVDNHKKEQRIGQLEAELASMQQAVIMPDAHTPIDLTDWEHDQINGVSDTLKNYGFSSVEIFSNGDTLWKK